MPRGTGCTPAQDAGRGWRGGNRPESGIKPSYRESRDSLNGREDVNRQ
jgi:hypothetical protein